MNLREEEEAAGGGGGEEEREGKEEDDEGGFLRSAPDCGGGVAVDGGGARISDEIEAGEGVSAEPERRVGGADGQRSAAARPISARWSLGCR